MIIIIFRQSRIVVASTTTLHYVKCLKYNNKACGERAVSDTKKNTKSPLKTGSHYTNFDQQVILINHWT